MANISNLYSVNFGRNRSGLTTVGYTLGGGSRVTAGVTEYIAGSGIYTALITHAVDFQGTLFWDSGQSPPAESLVTINPTYTIPTAATSAGPLPAPTSLGPLGFTPYAGDEDIAIKAAADFRALCPPWQRVVELSDGFFAANAPWVLRSTSTDLSTTGLAPGHVIALEGPKPTYPPSGLLYGISSVSSGGAVLRNLGFNDAVGKPPGPVAGLTGISFSAPTFGPQINTACLDLNRTYGIDPNRCDRTPGELYDPSRDLTQCVVLSVLKLQYLDESRAKEGEWVRKSQAYGAQLDQLLKQVSARWGPEGKAEPVRSIWTTKFRR